MNEVTGRYKEAKEAAEFYTSWQIVPAVLDEMLRDKDGEENGARDRSVSQNEEV